MKLPVQLAALAAASLLYACGRPAPLQHPHGHADVLLATDSGMGGLAFAGGHAYLSLANSASRPSAVLRTAAVNRASVWTPLPLGDCALAPAQAGEPWRSPALSRLGGTVYLYQRTIAFHEQALCRLERSRGSMVPHDPGLRLCRASSCEQLWMTGLQLHGGTLLSNAGGGANVLALEHGGRSWRALTGTFSTSACAHAAFAVAGRRLLVGMQCPPGTATLQAWELPHASAALPVAAPPLEGRAIHVIAPAGSAVFAGVSGGLLKSVDGGASFRFVIHHAPGSAAMPHIRHVLALGKRAAVVVAAGADPVLRRPYLAVSRDGGERWTDLSSILPGAQGSGAAVTSLAQDRQGRLLATLNLQPQAQGRLVLLTLGGVD